MTKTKKCPDCGVTKTPSEFNKDKRNKDGLQCYCKTCQVARTQAWRTANPDRDRNTQYKRKYGVTAEQVNEMVEAVGGRCPGCLRVTEDWNVDHNHDTGEVRGVLCGNCNRAAGLVGDNPAIMLRLAEFYSV